MDRPPPRFSLPDAATTEMYRRMTPAERLARAFRMWRIARNIIRTSIRWEHPDWTKAQVLRETANRISHGESERAIAEMKALGTWKGD